MSLQSIETISERVIGLISTRHDTPKSTISLDSQFVADLGFDSLDVVEFSMNVEEEFGISMTDEVVESIVSVRDAVEAIQELVSKSS